MSVNWPTSINACEMNIPKWSAALMEAGLLPELQHIIDGFENGFDQGIPDHKLGDLKWYTPDNYTSAVLAKEKIQASVTKEVEHGRMFGPFTQEEAHQRFGFLRSNPLGSVVNSDGKIRPINDLSHPKHNNKIMSVNSFVNKRDYATTWDDFKVVAEFFRTTAGPFELAIFAWEKAYRQIPTLMSQWPYLMVQDLPPISDAWKRVMAHEFEVVRIFRWVDDNLPEVLGIHTGIIRKHLPDTNPHANRDPVGRRCLHKFWHWSSSRQQVESIVDERDMARWGEPKRNCLVGNDGNPHRVDHGT
ncbi:hypothetical protein PSTG_17661 [Puccinia striiformis f. sp. tritici PST-78]|uniref:Uncharacterized protein n=1 Tax=Puccinia striiformis f. sp. tritici PST-78 TaxID=1165861 RepID=A0A0L0UP73_9BASI|nr:hypothetical protein PSTG_17661 [Puccinia striiformis f. sp. tritici PST-78]